MLLSLSSSTHYRPARRARAWAALAFVALFTLGGCASAPLPVSQAPSSAIAASAATELGSIAAQARARAVGGESGFYPMPQAAVALDARLALIRRAQASLDLQYYQLGNDETGHLLLRELRDAAARGVRVRLLLDDFYTAGMDDMLLGLAAHPNVEVRLFNPFGAGRVSRVGRWVNLATDFRRLNHRMHNKLFVADGAFAVVGGRNMADGYFLRDAAANFIDLDVLATGAIVPELSAIFDTYWNSPQVVAIQAVAPPDGAADALRKRFDAQVRQGIKPPPPAPPADAYGVPPLGPELDAGLPHLLWAPASAFADAPDKVSHGWKGADLSHTVIVRNLEAFRTARSEVLMFSPYFVPGSLGLKRMEEAREHGIALRVVTNSMAATDEPLASLAYERYRVPMLKLGVELYELSSAQLHRDPLVRAGFGKSRAQLHVKLGVIDRETVILGSMNLDQRSATTNTELSVTIRSRELTQLILKWFNLLNPEDARGIYRVQLAPDGRGLHWTALLGPRRAEQVEGEPEVDHLLRFKLFLMSLFVSEDLL
ncbi:MAG TPA: phospholipase D family protein [Albitalea sp.]|nr:phospholipase D family protein [Albitalea sp.]